MKIKRNKKKVVILAGGFGSRMAGGYEDIPKPMIPIEGVPILEHIIKECAYHELNHIVMLVHHKKQKIINHFRDGKTWDVSIDYLHEEEPLGTGGALYECFDWLDEDFLILYADVYSKVDLRKLISFHHENRNDMTCVTHPNDHPFDSDILETDNYNKIIKVHPHPRLDTTWLPNNINAAMYCANKKIFNCRVQKRKFDIAQHLLPLLINNDFKVGAYKTVEYLKDMGTPNRLSKVKLDVKRNIDLKRAHFSKKKAIYIDRDGTINKEEGHISELDQFALETEAALAIKKINSSHYLAFCVTNQPVIARGEASERKILSIHNKMSKSW